MTLTKRFVSLCVALALMFSMLTINAAAANASNGLNISYRMDGENVVETIEEYQKIKNDFENHPIVVNYLYLKEEVDEILQSITSYINGQLLK